MPRFLGALLSFTGIETNFWEETEMKKVFALLLALTMLLSLAACGGDKKDSGSNAGAFEPQQTQPQQTEPKSPVELYVEENKEALLASMEESFSGSSGMTCTSDLHVEGNGIIIDLNINELDDLTEDEKQEVQSLYDAMGSMYYEVLTECRTEIPELEFITMNIREVDGDLIAALQIDDSLAESQSQPTQPTGMSIQEYVDAYGQELVASMEESFATSSGMTCESDIRAMGNGIEIALYINELDNLDQAQKDEIQQTYDTVAPQMTPALTAIQAEVPQVDYIYMFICEVDGDLIATLCIDANGGPDETISNFVYDNYEDLIASMEESFESTSGITCQCTATVIGKGIVINIYMDDVDDTTDEEKQTIQSMYDSMGAAWADVMESMRADLPGLEFFVMDVCEEDGDPIASVVLR